MVRFLYSAAVSVDGFIAGPGGDASWMVPYLGPNPTVDALVPDIGALLVGRRTFGGDDPYKGTEVEGEAFGGAWRGPQVVVTHRPPAVTRPDVTFATDIDQAADRAAALAAARGRPYVNVLGADVARQLFARGRVDEVLVTVVPVLLGAGTRLFDEPAGRAVRLERISLSEAAQASNIWLRVIKD
jgi:dihydrofolate reductase